MDKPVMQNVSISRPKKILIFSVICLTAILIYLNSRILRIDEHWTVANDLPVAKIYDKHKMKEKIILYWNTFFGTPGYFGVGNSMFQNCSVSNCYATYDKSLLPSEQYDAIIFHAPRYTTYSDGYPLKRCTHQKYIFYSLESPYNINFEKLTKHYFYNWTMTYRQDSDIHSPYASIVKSNTNYEPLTVEDLKNKTKKVAWFVSNCDTPGSKRRTKYAAELSKYIQVDIYGKCGSLKCDNRTYCYEMLQRDYKFYLSFENSMCKDYVTEKLFNVLHYNIIPIVLGIFDYGNIAPPNSVINANDFKSPKDLADFLFMLDRNSTEYLKYLEWKKSYVVQRSTHHILCQMCEQLNLPITYSSYDNIEDWFFGHKCVL